MATALCTQFFVFSISSSVVICRLLRPKCGGDSEELMRVMVVRLDRFILKDHQYTCFVFCWHFPIGSSLCFCFFGGSRGRSFIGAVAVLELIPAPPCTRAYYATAKSSEVLHYSDPRFDPSTWRRPFPTFENPG